MPDDAGLIRVLSSAAMRLSRCAALVALSAAAFGLACGRLPGGAPLPASVWLLPAPSEGLVSPSESLPAGVAPFEGPLIVIDSSNFNLHYDFSAEPIPAGASRVALITTFQGARYHPESIRAITDDSIGMANFAGLLSRTVVGNSNGLFIDFQGGTPDDLAQTTSLLRAIADSARAHGVKPVGIVVPPGDTVGYPTELLARMTDLIVLRLSGEHRAGTAPGALVSPEWMARQIGIRASGAGVARLVADLPLFGYRWNRDASVSQISYSAAQMMVRSEGGVFRRDPASGSLTYSSARDGWTIWIQDAATVERLVVVARRAGVRMFALSGVAGADPDIWTRLPSVLRR